MLAWMGGARRKLKAAQKRGMGRLPPVGHAIPGQSGGPWLQHTLSQPNTPSRKRKGLSAGALQQLDQLGFMWYECCPLSLTYPCLPKQDAAGGL